MTNRKLSVSISAIFMALALFAAAPILRSQNESVAEAARRAKEQKARQQAKPGAKVITNEDIAALKGPISVVGPEPEPPPTATAAPDGSTPAAPGTNAAAAKPGPPGKDAQAAQKPEENGEAYWRAKFADAHRTEASDAKELDILQREFNLKQQQYYSDPNQAMREQNSRNDLNDTQQKINEKKAAVEKDKQAVSALEDQLRKAGGDAGWARDPSADKPVPDQPKSNGQPNNP
jgi:hypothetical protein